MSTAADVQLLDGMLTLQGSEVLAGVPAQVSVLDDPMGVGVFLRATVDAPAAELRAALGTPRLRRFTCCYRYDPWWVTPAAGTHGHEIPVGTHYLLAELPDGQYAVFLPLLDGPFCCTLEGEVADGLTLVAESGDPASVSAEVAGLFIAVGDDPYRLMAESARSVTAYMGTGHLRADKPLPDFTDLFGWCTWDAFYQDVSHENVRLGLESFAAGGVNPRYLILDDGWHSRHKMATGEERLTAFAADPVKFPDDLAATVTMAKSDFAIDLFLVWHTLQGYWGGVDGAAMTDYRVREMARAFPGTILRHAPEINKAFGSIIGLVDPADSYRFFQDFHRYLRLQGVDGVKVDSQGSLDGIAYGHGGMAELMRIYHAALEGAAQTHFFGRLINCMSVSTNVAYHTLNSTLMRSFTDFWPNDPASHGLHLYANAQSSYWLGEFIHPDWDMFQSGHPMGAFHAAGRAVSGGPVYVSDKPDGHNFDLLRKMVLSDGTVLRAQGIGRPTRDCLFANPTREDVLLKIFNLNESAGVVGVFNARTHAEEAERMAIAGTVSPADVEGLPGEQFVLYTHNAQTLTLCAREEGIEITLPELAFEIVTIVPVEGCVAPIGLTDKFNSAGAITAKGADAHGGYFLALRDGGDLLVWCAQAPKQVLVDEEPADFTYTAASGALQVAVPVGQGGHVLRIGL